MAESSKYPFLRKLNNKYRLAVSNDGTFEERFVLKITPLLVFSVGLIISFLVFLFSFLLFSYTPLKEYVPGITNQESRNNLIVISSRLDSLATVLDSKDLYLKNLRTILNGGVVVLENRHKASDSIKKNISLENTPVDSLFRLDVEKKTTGDYVSNSSVFVDHFTPPLVGVFTEKYDKKKNHFGVDLVGKKGAFVFSVADGVVVLNNWTKETGFIVAIQHADGFLSFYKHNSSVLKSVGSFVRGGEEIAIIGSSGELSSGPHLHFELWKNGESLNPQNYIIF
tara:strand:+ start:1105 stop:1950 length:846 start_codon:yes stop_codon:yes gene_type:complete